MTPTSSDATAGPDDHSTPAPGLAAAAALGLLAFLLGRAAPVIGGPVLAIALGVLTGRVAGPRPGWRPGLRIASKTVLQGSVVLLGLGLSLQAVARTGLDTLPVMLGTLAVALGAGHLLGRALGVEATLRTLVTCGTAICGASAIATISAVIGASEAAVAYSVTVIFVYNVLAALTFPALGHLLGMSQESFGIWAGTAINDTSSVVAAGTTYGAVAASTAVVVKLARTLMIVPIAIGQSVHHHRASGQGRPRLRSLVPPFLLLFLAAAALNSAGLVPAATHGPLHDLALLGTCIAMAAIGVGTPVHAVREAGWRPIALGGALWVLVAGTGLALQHLTGTA